MKFNCALYSLNHLCWLQLGFKIDVVARIVLLFRFYQNRTTFKIALKNKLLSDIDTT